MKNVEDFRLCRRLNSPLWQSLGLAPIPELSRDKRKMAQVRDCEEAHRNLAMTIALKGSASLLLFLVVSCLITNQVSLKNPRHEKFLRQHNDFPRTNVGQDYCGVMMHRRGMTRPCKDTNSFVHVPRNQLKDICSWAGTHYRRALRLSKVQLSVTTCKLQATSRGQCSYWAHMGQRHIIIGCDPAGWPIHFEESNFM